MTDLGSTLITAGIRLEIDWLEERTIGGACSAVSVSNVE